MLYFLLLRLFFIFINAWNFSILQSKTFAIVTNHIFLGVTRIRHILLLPYPSTHNLNQSTNLDALYDIKVKSSMHAFYVNISYVTTKRTYIQTVATDHYLQVYQLSFCPLQSRGAGIWNKSGSSSYLLSYLARFSHILFCAIKLYSSYPISSSYFPFIGLNIILGALCINILSQISSLSVREPASHHVTK
jgi:hypothetical protein